MEGELQGWERPSCFRPGEEQVSEIGQVGFSLGERGRPQSKCLISCKLKSAHFLLGSFSEESKATKDKDETDISQTTHGFRRGCGTGRVTHTDTQVGV